MKRLIAALVLAAPVAVAAQQPRDLGADSIDFGADRDRPESEFKLPAVPKPGDLIKYDPGRPASMSFYVDAASVTVSADGIVRFTSVAKGEGSTQNVAYEAIRCKTRERKVYAYGRADGTWHVLADSPWAPIRTIHTEGYRFTLYQDYFCPSRQVISSGAEGVDALRRGGHPRAESLSRNDPMPR